MKNVTKNPDGSPKKWTAYSHSGNERNRTFLNQTGRGFINVSPVSGADSIQDSRSFVAMYWNRDGFQDLVVVNANRPKLQLFQNQFKSEEHGFIGVRLTGGNHSSEPSDGFSNRDGIGARIVVETESGRILRVLSAGEGFASQNGKTVLIGIGKSKSVKSISVLWPSGRVTQSGECHPGGVLEFRERDGKFQSGSYSNR